MSERINLADPDFEPTDEQLIELSARAFAHIPAAREQSRIELRAAIEKERIAVRARLSSRLEKSHPAK